MTDRKEKKEKVNHFKRVKDCHRKKYYELDQEVQRMAKGDKTNHVENLAEEAEEAVTRPEDEEVQFPRRSGVDARVETGL